MRFAKFVAAAFAGALLTHGACAQPVSAFTQNGAVKLVELPGGFARPAYNFQGPTQEDIPVNNASINSSSPSSAIAWCGKVFANTYFSGTKTLSGFFYTTRGITSGHGSSLTYEADSLSTSASPMQPGTILTAGASQTVAISSLTNTTWTQVTFGTAPNVSWGEDICLTYKWSSPVTGDSFSVQNWSGQIDWGLGPGTSTTSDGSTWTRGGAQAAPSVLLTFGDGTYGYFAMGLPGNNSGQSSAFNSSSTPNARGMAFTSEVNTAVDFVGTSMTCGSTTATFSLDITDSTGAVLDGPFPFDCHMATENDGVHNMGFAWFPVLTNGQPFSITAGKKYYMEVVATGAGTIKTSSTTTASSTVASNGPAGANFYAASRTNSGGTGAWTDDKTTVPYMQVHFTGAPSSGTMTALAGGGFLFPNYNPTTGPYMQNGSLSSSQTIVSMTSANTAARIDYCGWVNWPGSAATKNINGVQYTTTGSLAVGSGGAAVTVGVYHVNTAASPLQPGTAFSGASSTLALASMASGNVVTNQPNFGSVATVHRGDGICIDYAWQTPGTSATFALGGLPSGSDFGFTPAYTSTSDGTTWALAIAIVPAPNFTLEFDDGTTGSFMSGVPSTISGNGSGYNSASTPNEIGEQIEFPFSVVVSGIEAAINCADTSATGTLELTDNAGTPNQLGSAAVNCASALRIGGSGPEAGIGYVLYPIAPVTLQANTPYFVGLKATSASPHNLTLPYTTTSGNGVICAEPGGCNVYYATRTGTGAWSTTNTQRPAFMVYISQVN